MAHRLTSTGDPSLPFLYNVGHVVGPSLGGPYRVDDVKLVQYCLMKIVNYGFRLEQTEIDGVRVWHWQRGQRRSPPFLNEDAARSWMDERLRTASLFND